MLRFTRLYSTQLRNIPSPTAEVPDVATFFNKIGRNMSQHAEQFESWEKLFESNGKSLKAMGIDTRDRRYLLGWIEKYKQSFTLEELKRGTKKWGGERNRKANRAAFYGRKAAEEKEK